MSIAPNEATRAPSSIWFAVRDHVNRFLFAPASALPLASLRIGVAFVLLVQAAMLRPELFEWFAHDGIFRGDLAVSLGTSFGPRMTDVLRATSPLGFNESQVIYAVAIAYVAALSSLAIGFVTRFAAAIAWFAHWTFMNSADPLLYGVDQYAHIFLFYLIWVPASQTLSIDAWLLRTSRRATSAARLGLRVMQLHLAISYFASGIEKARQLEWWTGDLIFRALLLPDFRQFDMTWLAQHPVLAQLACLSTLVVETGYVVFIWPRQTRRFWLAAILSLHVGIAVMLGLHFFGAMMCVLNASLFGVSSRPEKAKSKLRLR